MNRMSVLRRGLIVILAVLLLPWGAFGATVTLVKTSNLSDAFVSDHADVIVSVKRKCRTATMPSSPCGSDIADQLIVATFAGTNVAEGFFLKETWRGVGQVHAPPTGPPRFL